MGWRIKIFSWGMQYYIKGIPNASGYWWEIQKMQIDSGEQENII
jgi:hypothetical protein